MFIISICISITYSSLTFANKACYFKKENNSYVIVPYSTEYIRKSGNQSYFRLLKVFQEIYQVDPSHWENSGALFRFFHRNSIIPQEMHFSLLDFAHLLKDLDQRGFLCSKDKFRSRKHVLKRIQKEKYQRHLEKIYAEEAKKLQRELGKLNVPSFLQVGRLLTERLSAHPNQMDDWANHFYEKETVIKFYSFLSQLTSPIFQESEVHSYTELNPDHRPLSEWKELFTIPSLVVHPPLQKRFLAFVKERKNHLKFLSVFEILQLFNQEVGKITLYRAIVADEDTKNLIQQSSLSPHGLVTKALKGDQPPASENGPAREVKLDIQEKELLVEKMKADSLKTIVMERLYPESRPACYTELTQSLSPHPRLAAAVAKKVMGDKSESLIRENERLGDIWMFKVELDQLSILAPENVIDTSRWYVQLEEQATLYAGTEALVFGSIPHSNFHPGFPKMVDLGKIQKLILGKLDEVSVFDIPEGWSDAQLFKRQSPGTTGLSFRN